MYDRNKKLERKHSVIRRYFTGKIDNYSSKEDRHFNQRNLKAYIKGKQNFQYGFHSIKGFKSTPVWCKVLQEWK